MRLPLSLVFASLLAPGCASAPKPLEARAADDLVCPEKDTRLERVDDRTQWAIGCGRRLLYLRECADGRCEWKLSDSRSQQTK